MLFFVDFGGHCLVAHLQIRQLRAHGLPILVPALFVDRDKAGELHGLMGRTEHMTRAGGVNGNRVKDGVGHLGCQKTAPDQLIKPVLIPVQTAFDPLRVKLHMGWPDGFVGILRAGFCLEHVELAVIVRLAIAGADQSGGCRHGLIGQAQRIGSHIGNQAEGALPGHIDAFIELLRHGHGMLGRHAQLPGCLLLQRRGSKRRRGRTLFFRLFHIGDGEFLSRHLIHDCLGFPFAAQFPLLFLTPIAGCKGAGLSNPVELHIQRPVFLRLESADLVFPVHNQTGCHRLNASGGQPPANLFPEQWGKLVAHNPVQNAPRLLGIHQIIVDVPRMLNGLPDHLLGNLVKGDPMGLIIR